MSYAAGADPALADGAVFVLRASYARWQDVIRQELHPLKGLLQGKVRIEGHLPELLRWIRSLVILAELAGDVDTEFVDEHVRA